MEGKAGVEIETGTHSDGDFIPVEESKTLGTTDDQKDMHRMGKTQELRRNFAFFSIFGFSMILLSTWEAMLGSSFFALSNGGSAGLIYTYIGVAIGMSAVVASMAEMGSMAPTAGGQYHWVSEFAPPGAQKFLSYMVSWLCVLGWQTGSAASAFLAGMMIEGLSVLNHPEYQYYRWEGTLTVIAMVLVCSIFNTFFASKLPLVEGCVLILHVLGFFAIMIPLWILAPRASASDVFTQFVNPGWSSNGLACLVGILTPVVAMLGSDAAAHMSEELRDASRVLPRAMIATAAVNFSLGFVITVTLCFCLGDMNAILSSPVGQLGYPFIQVFYQGVQSLAGASIMTTILIILSTFCCMTNIAAASRQLFAFARDHGVPFSGFFSYVRPGWDIPLNAVLFTVFVSSLLALINIGSIIAYNNITSLGVCALLSSYIVSISCVCLKRIRGEPLLPRKFSLGRFGLAINIFSILFLVLIFIFCFFPPVPEPASLQMNWSIVIYGGVVLSSLLYYYFRGRHVYVGPTAYVRKDV